MVETRDPGSFRDPAGYVFSRAGVIHRRIEPTGMASYERLLSSGLYDALTREKLLVSHEDLGADPTQPGAATVLRPQQIPMVSYPYEWSLSQLRDAARVTLRAQRLAVRFGMTLKDASAFNVQFLDGRPILIDTLSFETYRGGPWSAYRQFCQHFYAPLMLAATRDARLICLGRPFLDGPPLSLVSKLLPFMSYLRPGPLLHIHLHARAEQRWSDAAVERPLSRPDPVPDGRSSSSRNVDALLDSLDRAVDRADWPSRSRWSRYYAVGESYSEAAFARKSQVISCWLERLRPSFVWDLGANTGFFSKAAARLGATTVAFDADPVCVDTMYRDVVCKEQTTRLLPLAVDLTNPSPAIGWANRERMTLESRGPADLLLALAVTHHLAIGNNVPFGMMAAYLARLGRKAIVEFIPRTDPMVKRLLSTRADIFTDYHETGFQQAFDGVFVIEERVVLTPSDRTLYLLTRR